MSEPLRQGWVAGTSGAAYDDKFLITFDYQRAAPPAGRAGYAKGAIYINTAGSLGSLVYANTGSETSATWTSIL